MEADDRRAAGRRNSPEAVPEEIGGETEGMERGNQTEARRRPGTRRHSRPCRGYDLQGRSARSRASWKGCRSGIAGHREQARETCPTPGCIVENPARTIQAEVWAQIREGYDLSLDMRVTLRRTIARPRIRIPPWTENTYRVSWERCEASSPGYLLINLAFDWPKTVGDTARVLYTRIQPQNAIFRITLASMFFNT